MFRAVPLLSILKLMSFCQLWDLLENKKLFKVESLEIQEYDKLNHLAHISTLLVPPPKDLDKGTRTEIFYQSNGKDIIVLSILANIC